MVRSNMVLETVAFRFGVGVEELSGIVGQDDGSRLWDCSVESSFRSWSEIFLPMRPPNTPATIAMTRP
jgi:hypothetical protein